MQTTNEIRSGATPLKRRAQMAIGLALVLVASAACRDLTKVQDVDVVQPGGLKSEGALPTLRVGALANFGIAYNGVEDSTGGGGDQISFSGMLADELINTETFPTRIQIDQRAVLDDNGDNLSAFTTLTKARAFADFSSQQFNTFPAHINDLDHAEILSLAGFSYILFAENYCSGVPFSTLNDDGSITYGQPLTTAQMLGVAIAKFDSALAIAAANGNDPTQTGLASVGKGRALLDSGGFVEAAAAVTAVPSDFQYVLEHSSNSANQGNGTWEFTWNAGRWGVADVEGTNGLDFVSANDPRVQVVDLGLGFDGASELFAPMKDSDRQTPIVVADGIEARLIEAEAGQHGGSGNTLAILNTLRAGAGLPALGAPPTGQTIIDQLFRERAFWLFLTSHRLGDLRRLVRQYGRPAETVFPTGEFFHAGQAGGPYGTDVNLIIPRQEANNPNFHGCIDRNA